VNDVKSGRRERYAALTRSAVLDAAKALFVAKGFEATSVEDIAKLSESSKGAVYHHFSDKKELFAEVFRASEAAIIQTTVESMVESAPPWDQIEDATRAFLRGYVADDEARALLRQAIGVLGWERVRALDEETALPILRGAFGELIRLGEIRPLPIDATSEMVFGLYCNAVLFIAASDAADSTSRDVETVVLALLRGLRA
jgi:AcrR family transcriptional regulator